MYQMRKVETSISVKQESDEDDEEIPQLVPIPNVNVENGKGLKKQKTKKKHQNKALTSRTSQQIPTKPIADEINKVSTSLKHEMDWMRTEKTSASHWLAEEDEEILQLVSITIAKTEKSKSLQECNIKQTSAKEGQSEYRATTLLKKRKNPVAIITPMKKQKRE